MLHKGKYNKLLKPEKLQNYKDRSLGKGFWWTQIKFARTIGKLKPTVCWMPIQQIPFLYKCSTEARPPCLKKTKYVVTIHDLAFKFFPKHFPLIDRLKINFYTDIAVKKADKIIAISEATKKDLIRLYPKIDKNKISVVHHGFDRENFQQKFSSEEKREFLEKWGIIESIKSVKSIKSKVESQKSVKLLKSDVNVFNDKGNYLKTPQNLRSSDFDPLYSGGGYLLYVGAIQPRKDLITLIRAFDKLKSQDTRYKVQTNHKIQDTRYKMQANGELQIMNDKLQANGGLQGVSDGNISDLKLVLVGEIAWKSEGTMKSVENSEFKDDIIVTGKVDFKELAMFYHWAKIFVFPSLYEGFGIPLLEAMASKTPVITANNSSLGEVGGNAVLKFRSGDEKELSQQIKKLLSSKNLQEKMIKQGLKRIEKFSWEKCAKETLAVLEETEMKHCQRQ